MLIRKARKEDSKMIFDLIIKKSEFDREMRGFDGEISTSVAKVEETLFGERPFAHVLLLEVEGNVIGFALYHCRYSSFSGRPSVWLDDLLVIQGHRSEGYGTELMKAVKSEAIKICASHISWTASPLNKRGQIFYLRLGASIDRIEGERPFYRWEVID